MGSVAVLHWDVFSQEIDKGNPAGVVLDAEHLTDNDMQHIAKEVGFNETSFIVSSDVADFGVRYFTPGHEMNVCGHATMAVCFALQQLEQLPEKETITIETKAGILPVEMAHNVCRMQQAAPRFSPFEGEKVSLMASIGLTIEDLDERLPITYGSTGIWTLLIPIRSLTAFSHMKPDQEKFPSILTDMPRVSVHPFCVETFDPKADMHARHFSSPFSGTVEDPVTGTASGVMGAYYARYIHPGAEAYELVVEQGQEIGRDGRVFVHVKNAKTDLSVAISGTAMFVKQWNSSY
ncbi:PhzF family phenazine biosynthesis protein [Alkalicoccobacillus murimartini]|uniref:PhzF family phenazine biosynthesis protein n=1 Tax=Alkalicoccobacillus murimartini TaxID=171685 RepID=A0ABT9YGA3_9BACI|nr:PhzF family phenazine biosynthesis protein [Alkalicoccobacillus murimartini]MDQ0206247.1 PhzF family phenazine biosynthesis protein [Alkalicoccobacillus murimartini]